MGDFTGLIMTMKAAAMGAVEASDPAGVFFGTVTSTAPLEITVEQKITLTEPQLTLSRNVTDFQIDMTVSHWTEDETAHTHTIIDTYMGGGTSLPTSHRHAYTGRKTITVHNGLIVGDRVILLRVQGGQNFIVLDRVAS